MKPELSPSQLTLLIGGTLLVGLLVAVLIYATYKLLRREKQESEWKPARVGAQGDAAFVVGTLQGLLAQLRAQEKTLTEQLRNAEQRAAASEQTLALIIREMHGGLLMFNREGFLTLSNPAARALLEVDTWARRRYPEILGLESALAAHIGECLESGKALKEEKIEYHPARGETRVLDVSITPCYDQNGQREGVLCLLEDAAGHRPRE